MILTRQEANALLLAWNKSQGLNKNTFPALRQRLISIKNGEVVSAESLLDEDDIAVMAMEQDS